MTDNAALVIEDDASIRADLNSLVSRLGLAVESVGTVAEALEKLNANRYRVVLVDLGLPDGSGIDVLQHLTEVSDPPAVLVVSSAMDVDVRNTCLRLGARDFIAKPFRPTEAARRVERAMEEVPAASAITRSEHRITVGDVSLDLELRRVSVGPRAHTLSPREASALRILMTSPGRLFDIEMLGDWVWERRPHVRSQVTRLLGRLAGKVDGRRRSVSRIVVTEGGKVAFRSAERSSGDEKPLG